MVVSLELAAISNHQIHYFIGGGYKMVIFYLSVGDFLKISCPSLTVWLLRDTAVQEGKQMLLDQFFKITS